MLEQSSGNAILDLRAQSAIQVTQRLPALPPAYPNTSLNVHYSFQFHQ
jgi:hypothetical protein